jgi:hypothetical protein
MMYKISLAQAFEKVDERWVEAFGGKELRLSGQEGLDKFRKCLAGAPRLVMNSPSRLLIGCTSRYRQMDVRNPEHGVDGPSDIRIAPIFRKFEPPAHLSLD